MVFTTRRWTISASKGRLMKSVTPRSKARSTWEEPLSAEIMITGMSSIQPFLFIMFSTPKPSSPGMTISSSTSEISLPRVCSMATPSLPFSASRISYSSPSISARMERFISESSTMRIFCLSETLSKVAQPPFFGRPAALWRPPGIEGHSLAL